MISNLNEMGMIADAYARYLKLFYAEPGAAAPAPATPSWTEFRYTTFDRASPEFTRRWFSLLVPSLMGGRPMPHNLMRGTVPPEQEEAANIWLENVVAFYSHFNKIVLEIANHLSELETLGAPRAVLEEAAAIIGVIDTSMKAMLESNEPPTFGRKPLADRLDKLIAQSRIAMDLGRTSSPAKMAP